MADWIENLRAAIWSALDADADLDTATAGGPMFGGTKFRFDGAGPAQRYEADQSLCPMLAALPLGPVEQPTGLRGASPARRAATIRVECTAAGPSTSAVTALRDQVVETLLESPRGLVDGDPLDYIAFEEGTIRAVQDLKQPTLLFIAAFDLRCVFRT